MGLQWCIDARCRFVVTGGSCTVVGLLMSLLFSVVRTVVASCSPVIFDQCMSLTDNDIASCNDCCDWLIVDATTIIICGWWWLGE